MNIILENTYIRATFQDRLAHSIDLLRKYEKIALKMSDKGFFLAFSGGKDSQAIYHVAKLAGVLFEAHYSLTTLDPPELVRFIRSNYPDVITDRPKETFAQICIRKKALPTQTMRFCCAVLKEGQGAGTVTLTGVRKAESVKRSKRNEVEISNRKFSGTTEQFDQFTYSKEIEGIQCVKGKDKIIVNPIIDWTERDVWHFLNEVVRVEHCCLYDQGWRRIGCLFCPMARKSEIQSHEKRYPKYKDMILRTIHKLRINGYANKYPDLTDEEVFEWWKSKEKVASFYARQKSPSLFDNINQ